MIREALIPAAGRGLRLDRPHTPKPLVDVGGRALLLRLIDQLERAGVERVVVVVGHEGRQVARVVSSHPWTTEVRVVHAAGWEAGLVHSLLSARDELAGPFVLAMADHVFDDALIAAAVAAPPPPGGLTMFIEPRLDRVFDLDSAVKLRRAHGTVTAMGRSVAPFDAVDAGLFVAQDALFDALAPIRPGDPTDDLGAAVLGLARARQLELRPIADGAWDDVDTPAALVHAELRLRRERRAAVLARPEVRTSSAPPLERHTFAPPGPPATSVVLGRGLLTHPEDAGLIPAGSASSPIFVFTDEIVHELHGRRFVERLRHLGHDVHPIVLPVGEESKSLANYGFVVERVLGRGVDERSVLISLGGGVVCNVCGFVAATIYRGLDLVHLPTTLMAQCDAAVSHKQGINGKHGKNLIGSYFPPRLVAIDVDALATLDDRLLCDGLAEAIKHALCQDPGYVDFLLANVTRRRDPLFLEEVVRRNVALKCALVTSDPHERREAIALQYGHAIGHAVEHLSHYQLHHGEAVAVGMVVSARLARLMGIGDDEALRAHLRLLAAYGLPIRVPDTIRDEDLVAALQYDKNQLVEGTRLPLAARIGRLYSHEGDFAIPVSRQALLAALAASRDGEVPR